MLGTITYRFGYACFRWVGLFVLDKLGQIALGLG